MNLTLTCGLLAVNVVAVSLVLLFTATVAELSLVQEVETYWRKLLEVCAVDRLQVRCRTVVPENFSRLPAHMSLTSKLLASPRALARIQLYCRNRPGYIVPGVLGREEVGTVPLNAISHVSLLPVCLKFPSCARKP